MAAFVEGFVVAHLGDQLDFVSFERIAGGVVR